MLTIKVLRKYNSGLRSGVILIILCQLFFLLVVVVKLVLQALAFSFHFKRIQMDS